MGYIYELTCQQCKKTKRLYLGQGIRDYQIDFVVQNYPYEAQKEIKMIAAGSAEYPIWNFEKKLGWCEKCKEYIEIPELDILASDGVKNIKITGRCHCGNTVTIVGGVKRVEQKKLMLECPLCGKNLEKMKSGIWD